MEQDGGTTALIGRHRAGDPQARNELIGHACDRLRSLAHRMLGAFPSVRRWQEADDVLHNALLRLHRALKNVEPKSSLHFWNLAARQIRWELLDLAQSHCGPQGYEANHHTDRGGKAADDPGQPLHQHPDSCTDPDSLEEWALFHKAVEALPEEEREIVGLLWYEGHTQEEVAALLGVSLRAVKRRWQSARIKLASS